MKIDLSTLTRYDNEPYESPWPVGGGKYVLFADVEKLVADAREEESDGAMYARTASPEMLAAAAAKAQDGIDAVPRHVGMHPALGAPYGIDAVPRHVGMHPALGAPYGIAGDWMTCERITGDPQVDDALRNFIADQTQDNGTGLVQAAITAYLTIPRVPTQQEVFSAVAAVAVMGETHCTGVAVGPGEYGYVGYFMSREKCSAVPMSEIHDLPQPYAGAVVLLETIAEYGALAKFEDGSPTPNATLCRKFAAELRQASKWGGK